VDPLSVVRVMQLDEGALAPLLAAADAEAHAFVRRLANDWRSGANRFDRGPGEAYWSLRNGGEWVAAGGLNIDPRAGDPRTGRVRHVYVLPEWRRRGCARALFARLLSHAQPHFDRLLLHTERAAAFWERQGFVRFDDERTHSTHALQLRLR
jgi:GNAT superfamily N-acetyltransferase